MTPVPNRTAAAIAAQIEARTPLKPEIAIILGSGMGALADAVEGIRLPYTSLPGMPPVSVQSHAGEFAVGTLVGRRVVTMSGRVHAYEGHDAATTAIGVRVMAALGAKTLIASNAAGALNPDLEAGSLALIEDHLSLPNLAGGDPLRGGSVAERFTSLNGAYDTALLNLAEAAARKLDLPTRRAVYAHVSGPSFETPAEVRLLRLVGCDVVGMSTVPEVIVARALGLRVLAISGISNVAIDTVATDASTTAQEAWDTLAKVGPRVGALIEALVPEL